MKKIPFSSFLVASLATSSVANAFVTNFDSYSTGALVGQNGWSGSPGATTGPATGRARVVDGYAVSADNSRAIFLGRAPASPATITDSTVTVGNSYGGFFEGTRATFDFRLIDQVGTDSAVDVFGFNVSSGSTTISIYFAPTPTPSGQPAGAYWEVGYSLTGLAGYTPFPEQINLVESAVWNFDLSIVANAVDPTKSNVAVTITGAGSATGNLVAADIDPEEVASNFYLSWNKTGVEYSANYIAIDNLSVVPEPSAALLLGLGGLGLAIRRRRA